MSVALPQRRLVSQNDAAISENSQVPRSRFTGAWTRKTSFDAGYLVPIMIEEVLPGDHLSYNLTAYVRMATPLFPLFDNQRIDTFWFYVPNRLLWTNWVRLMGEEVSPAASIDFTVPVMTSEEGGYANGSIYDHFGLPVVDSLIGVGDYQHSALPLRAYNLIWNTWFRDQNIQFPVTVHQGDTGDVVADYELLRRAKSHDYFTSALPWPQKFTAINPISGQAPVIGIGSTVATATNPGPNTVRESDGGTQDYAFSHALWDVGQLNYMRYTAASGGYPMVFADLSQATGVSINTFRQAFMVQSLLERDARGGTRYVELIRQHFGVVNPDFRLQRPEYIGGGQTALNITPIAQTAPTAGLTVGSLGAAGTAAGQHRASYAATEHGYIIALINVRSEISYQQGLHKLWSRSTRYDFYWPSLAGLGEQAILRKEIFCNGVPANDDAVFGYQERWHEYRTRYSEVTGLMRSNIGDTLDPWHLSQYFEDAPLLSEEFIQDLPPMDRILAAAELTVNQQYLADLFFERTAVRPIPTYGTPAQLGRF